MKYKKCLAMMIAALVLMCLVGCGSSDTKGTKGDTSKRVDWEKMSCSGSMELDYAKQFSVDYYDTYRLITIVDSGRFLLVKEGMPVPQNLPEDVVVLQQPLDRGYLVSTSVMDFVEELEAVDHIRLSGTKQSDWAVESAKEAMENGDMLYAGKYSAPDYELILQEECDLAIENTMIYHKPEVKEKLESFGIPVLVERSSYEEHPLGRLEWLKLYGVLFEKEEAATESFEKQLQMIEPIMGQDATGKTVAFFYINSNGAANVRKPNDYIAKMISLCGGTYIFEDLPGAEENALSSMNMQMEDFYATAKDADIVIYNSTIDGEISSVEELIAKDALLADFKAVKDGNAYCANKDFFQETMGMGTFMKELHQIICGEETDGVYLIKLR